MANHYCCVTSKALWPRLERHCVPTGKAAQGRRVVIMGGIWGFYHLYRWRTYLWFGLSKHFNARQGRWVSMGLTIWGMICVLSALFDKNLMLNHWFVFILLAALCAFIVLNVVFARYRRQVALACQYAESSPFTVPGTSPGHVPSSKMGSFAASFSRRSIPRTQLPFLFAFPDTPMPVPATPLIRVLETIDLSSANVPHFLDTKPHPIPSRPTHERHGRERKRGA